MHARTHHTHTHTHHTGKFHKAIQKKIASSNGKTGPHKYISHSSVVDMVRPNLSQTQTLMLTQQLNKTSDTRAAVAGFYERPAAHLRHRR